MYNLLRLAFFIQHNTLEIHAFVKCISNSFFLFLLQNSILTYFLIFESIVTYFLIFESSLVGKG